MPIKQLTPPENFDNHLHEHILQLEAIFIRRMMYVGERCVVAGRSTKSYKDRTGNLRSSIGYVVARDGKIITASDFKAEKGEKRGSMGTEGSAEGLEFAKKLVAQFPEGIVLIVVAGMNYAKHVSSKGLDVLDSSELLAQKLVPQMLKQLGLK